MPIKLDEAGERWIIDEPTEAEKASLVNLGMHYIMENYGERAGQRIVDMAMNSAGQTSKGFVVPEGGFQGQA